MAHEDDQLPVSALNPGMLGGRPELSPAQEKLLECFKRLPKAVQTAMLAAARKEKEDFLDGNQIRMEESAAGLGEKDERDNTESVMADSESDGPSLMEDTTEDDPFADTTDDDDATRSGITITIQTR